MKFIDLIRKNRRIIIIIASIVLLFIFLFLTWNEIKRLSRKFDMFGHNSREVSTSSISTESNKERLSNLLEINNSALSNRKIVKNANFSIDVENYAECYKKILEKVLKFNGYVESEYFNQSNNKMITRLTIRIPAQSFDVFINDFLVLPVYIRDIQINFSDETDSFIDIETRLKNKRKLEGKYLEILKQASSIDEILRVESYLAEVRADIESTEARFKDLNQKLQYSTVHLEIEQKDQKKRELEKKKSENKIHPSSFKKGWSIFLVTISIVIIGWPFIVIFLIFLFLFKLKNKRKKLSTLFKKKNIKKH